ncbi:hypothetical protein PMAYCL1PPCAC_25487, partial [Pristionchus mayeri]
SILWFTHEFHHSFFFVVARDLSEVSHISTIICIEEKVTDSFERTTQNRIPAFTSRRIRSPPNLEVVLPLRTVNDV